jgi:putative ABC transport system substrate-binding protein
MRRRDFVAIAIGVAGALWPLTLRAQPVGRVYRIGVLARTCSRRCSIPFGPGCRISAMSRGQNVGLEVRNAAGQSERFPELAADLLSEKVEIIMAINTPAAKAAAKATTTVPIVMMRVADPVKSGLIASLSHSRGNVTRLYFMPDVLGAKSVELLRGTMPAILACRRALFGR